MSVTETFTRMCSHFTSPKQGCLQYVSPAATVPAEGQGGASYNQNIGSMALADIPKQSFSYMEVNIMQVAMIMTHKERFLCPVSCAAGCDDDNE
jgi:hypothetical protein